MTSNTTTDTTRKINDGGKQQLKSFLRGAGSRLEESLLLKCAAIGGLSCLLGVLAYVSWVNIGPYVLFIQGLSDGQNWLELLPGIGAIVRWANTSVSVLVGCLLWALIQTGQILWVLIMLDRKATRNALKAQTSSAELYDASGKDFVVKRIAKRTGRVPLLFIRWSHTLALFAYAVDGVLGLSLFPPAKSMQSLLLSLTIGAGQGIYWENITSLLVMMFAFEPLFFVSVIVFQWISTHRSEQ
jgi:hypothetical protein